MNGTSGMPLYSWRLMDAHLNDSISAEESQELESLLLANATGSADVPGIFANPRRAPSAGGRPQCR